jgi:SpoVK/Ycf46/Vps4 family AAA+-type ATPase
VKKTLSNTSGDGQVKRIYVPLPDAEARRALLKNLLKGDDYALQGNTLSHILAVMSF